MQPPFRSDTTPRQGETRLFETRRRKMTFIKHILVLTSLLLMPPCLAVAQEQRPAIVPLAQGGGSSSAASASSSASIGGLSDGPIAPGEVVHINVFDAPDFSLITRVSETGDVPYPILGSFHIGGLNSASAAQMLAKELRERNLMLDPEITVTVDSSSTGITVLGEVHSPGIYPPPGKRQLSDLLATAGGLTANTGRIIEITNDRNSGKKEYVSWDPTMHNTENFDRPVFPGDRVLVRACGIAYVGGNVNKPGAYKRRVLRHFASKYALNTMIETGTLNAEMDLAMKDQFRRIITIELSPEYHATALKRLARYPYIECLRGDSSIVLPRVLADIHEPCLFWLDAHYSAGPTAKGDIETPISAELNAVLNHEVRNHVVLIDDARHFDGTHDYPRIAELKESVARIRPDLLFTLENDIIRITPNSDRQ
jgi:protein involved in polysaccharide export with SLBB domain